MLKQLLTATVMMASLSSPAHSQVDINAHVTDYVKELHGDVRLLKNWSGVLKRQPIQAGKTTPESIQKVFESVSGEYISDAFNYGDFWKPEDGFFDYWATPEEFKKNGGGDCEDFAIAWYYSARERGYKPEQLNIWIGYLPEENIEHAVLAIEFQGEEYIMDSMSSEVLSASDYMQKDFKLMYRFNENGWSTK